MAMNRQISLVTSEEETPFLRKEAAGIGPGDCLSKTQDSAKSKDDV